VGKKEIMETVHASGLGGTYGANPVACSAALAVMDIFAEEELLTRAEALGRKLLDHFLSLQKEFEIVGDVRGKGPMLALELVLDRERKEPASSQAKALVRYCFEHGLILLSCGNHGNVIRTLMPLVITNEHLERGISILADGLKAVHARS
jgi:4-aminobutyrate aminotransferase/(S)-3-amino-2-methylpropionate transaminase